MFKPMTTLLTLVVMSFSLNATESEEKSGWERSNIWGVKKIKERRDGSFKVKCNDKSKGFISFEEENICVFSKHKDVSKCESHYEWSFEQAAEFLCQEVTEKYENEQ